MKFFLSLFTVILSISQTSALSIQARDVDDRSAEARSSDSSCANPNYAIAFLRAFNPGSGDHFYTTSVSEMENAVGDIGYKSEGTAALVFGSRLGLTIPLYRLYSPSAGDHFYTTSASERDHAISSLEYVSEGTAAFVYGTQICDSVPLYRLYSPGADDHFYTTSITERDNAASNSGYVNEGTAAYVLQNP